MRGGARLHGSKSRGDRPHSTIAAATVAAGGRGRSRRCYIVSWSFCVSGNNDQESRQSVRAFLVDIRRTRECFFLSMGNLVPSNHEKLDFSPTSQFLVLPTSIIIPFEGSHETRCIYKALFFFEPENMMIEQPGGGGVTLLFLALAI